MRSFAGMLLGLCLVACSGAQTGREAGFLDNAGWRQRQAIRDANIILQGMHDARAQAESVARRTAAPQNTQ